MLLGVSLIAVVVVLVALYLLFYGGFDGPIEWLMKGRTQRRLETDQKVVALTFDDGPDPVRTPALLDVLAEQNAPATFFVLGDAAEMHPGVVARIAREGHELGNHTYCHRYLPLARSRSVERELAATDRAVATAAGVVPKVARPPWGGRRPGTVRAFARLAKRLVTWDVNSDDWKGAPADALVKRVLERTRPGSIILMHEARENGEVTIEAVRRLIPELRARGYELVTVSGGTQLA